MWRRAWVVVRLDLFSKPVQSPKLRAYQIDAIDSVRREMARGRKRILLVSPTGSGKTVMMAEMVRGAVARGRRVLIVVHLRELIDQTIDKLRSAGVDHVGVLRGDDDRIDPNAPVQVASIQTLARRAKPMADLVILDECHRSISEGYHTHIWKHYDCHIIGFTATPQRTDGRGLGERFDAIVVAATYSALIAEGHVAGPVVYAPKDPPDLSGVKKRGGDYDEAQLEEVMRKLSGHIVPTWQEKAEGRVTVVFASGIDHSKDIVARFVAAGLSAAHLDGTTPDAERRDTIARLRAGKVQIVSNCGVLTEGFDAPEVRCVVIARPTASLILHMQTAGRGLRPGPVQPVIIDHANNVAVHGLPHEDREWSLDGSKKKPKEKNPYRTCKGCFAYVPARDPKCPYCGFVNPAAPRDLPEEIDAPMVSIGAVDVERNFYLSHVEKAFTLGLKPGFPAVKFKERFGRWPPWSWSNESKALYESDEGWQQRCAQRAAQRERWSPVIVREPYHGGGTD